MQTVRPGGKYLYLLSHLARLKKSLVSEQGLQAHSVADSEGLVLGKCFYDKCLYRLLPVAVKGQMDWGKPCMIWQVDLYFILWMSLVVEQQRGNMKKK